MGRPAVLKIDILADAKGVGRGVSEAEGRLGRLGRAGAVVGAAAAAGLAAAGAAVGAFGLAAVGAASRAEQSAGAIESVYGSAASQVEQYASTSASQLGLAASSYRELSAVVGSQLRNMGRSQAEAAGQSDELIRMGADLAATFGGDVSTAVEAVGSLLRGERDPIEQYGVAIKQADIDARLAAQGLSGLTGEARRQAEATATLALLTEQTAGAQGAFARESGTLAGAQAILGAKFEDVKARLGAGLLPALATGATFLADRVLPAAERVTLQLAGQLGPAVQRLGQWFTSNLLPAASRLSATFTANVLPALTSVARFVVGTVIPAAGQLFAWFAQKIAPALAGVVVSAIRGVQAGLQTVGAAIDRNRPQLEALLAGFRRVAEFIAANVVPVLGGVLGGALRTVGALIGGAIDNVGGLVRAFQRVIDMVGRASAAVRSFRLPDLNPFAADVTTGAPQLAGRVGALGPGIDRLATAAAGDALVGTALAGAGTSRGVVVVDRSDRRVSVTVQGALDPVGVARQIGRLLDEHALRTGARPAYGPAL